jgi:hypothetical protein
MQGTNRAIACMSPYCRDRRQRNEQLRSEIRTCTGIRGVGPELSRSNDELLGQLFLDNERYQQAERDMSRFFHPKLHGFDPSISYGHIDVSYKEGNGAVWPGVEALPRRPPSPVHPTCTDLAESNKKLESQLQSHFEGVAALQNTNDYLRAKLRHARDKCQRAESHLHTIKSHLEYELDPINDHEGTMHESDWMDWTIPIGLWEESDVLRAVSDRYMDAVLPIAPS